jgi:hypothetical protein
MRIGPFIQTFYVVHIALSLKWNKTLIFSVLNPKEAFKEVRIEN